MEPATQTYTRIWIPKF